MIPFHLSTLKSFYCLGLPAISIPHQLSEDGFPVGLQIIGPYMKDSTVFKVARAMENTSLLKSLPPLVRF
jgi:Asp-tRNA(Asn)/Glu-tRNA(Gln) amidotransferase A subunit family amidase